MKYLNLKAKNKKFRVIKIDEENNINIKDEDKNFSINLGKKRKNLTQRNRFEKINNTIKNYTIQNDKNCIKNRDLQISEDIPSIKVDKDKYNKDSIKKISLNKKRLLTLINNSKIVNFHEKVDNSSNYNKINSYNNNAKNSLNDDFNKAYEKKDMTKALPLKSSITKKFFSSNYDLDEENNNNFENHREYLEPFDLNSIFIQKIDIIKERIIKEGELKKWKNRIKKKGCFLSKNNEQIDFNIKTFNNDINSNINIAIVKAIKKKGSIQICKNIIKNIICKMK